MDDGLHEIRLATLVYSKADLDAAPADDRAFFLMGASVANDVQTLSKLLAVMLEEPDGGNRIVNQGNSASAFLALRMLAGRLLEGFKLVARHSKGIKADYEVALSEDARAGFRAILAHFSGGQSLLLKVRDQMAFHHLRKAFDAAYQRLRPEDELGDYHSPTVGNTLYLTTELLHYHALAALAEEGDVGAAIRRLVDDVHVQTRNFNNLIHGFSLVFAQRHLGVALSNLRIETEVVRGPAFEALTFPFFSRLPEPKHAASNG